MAIYVPIILKKRTKNIEIKKNVYMSLAELTLDFSTIKAQLQLSPASRNLTPNLFRSPHFIIKNG